MRINKGRAGGSGLGARGSGQATLEMTVALIGALLLLFGSLKIFLWVNERLIARQQAYDSTRRAAGRGHKRQVVGWDEPSKPLRIFHADE